MTKITKSQPSNITSPNGNSLAVFVDGITGILMVKDIYGNVEPISEFLEKNPIIPSTLNYGLFTQTEDSTPITATNQELSLIGNGVGSLTIPANAFSVGNSFKATFVGKLSCVGTATLDIRVKTETGIVLADTQVIGMDVTTNKFWNLEINFTIREIGGANVASIASGGIFSYTKNSGLNFEGTNFSSVNSTTFDTTIENKLIVTGQWNTNNANNSILTEIFILNKTY